MAIKRINARNKNVLIIGDTHLPFAHKDHHHFLKEVKNKFLEHDKKKNKTDYIVCHVGDEVDFHGISFHTADVDLPFSPSAELEEAIDMLHMKDGMHDLYPNTFVCSSNHGDLVYRKGKHHGLPRSVFRSYSEILQTKKWSWHDDLLLRTNNGNVYVCHGRTKIHRLVQSVHSSCVQGHFHGLHSIDYWNTPNSEYNIFGAQTGCLIDDESLCFSYNKLSVVRPMLGSLLITKDGKPQLLTMSLDKHNRWNGKL